MRPRRRRRKRGSSLNTLGLEQSLKLYSFRDTSCAMRHDDKLQLNDGTVAQWEGKSPVEIPHWVYIWTQGGLSMILRGQQDDLVNQFVFTTMSSWSYWLYGRSRTPYDWMMDIAPYPDAKRRMERKRKMQS